MAVTAPQFRAKSAACPSSEQPAFRRAFCRGCITFARLGERLPTRRVQFSWSRLRESNSGPTPYEIRSRRAWACLEVRRRAGWCTGLAAGVAARSDGAATVNAAGLGFGSSAGCSSTLPGLPPEVRCQMPVPSWVVDHEVRSQALQPAAWQPRPSRTVPPEEDPPNPVWLQKSKPPSAETGNTVYTPPTPSGTNRTTCANCAPAPVPRCAHDGHGWPAGPAGTATTRSATPTGRACPSLRNW